MREKNLLVDLKNLNLKASKIFKTSFETIIIEFKSLTQGRRMEVFKNSIVIIILFSMFLAQEEQIQAFLVGRTR